MLFKHFFAEEEAVTSLPWGLQPPLLCQVSGRAPVKPSSTSPARSQHWGDMWEHLVIPLLPLLLLPLTCLPLPAAAPGVDVAGGAQQAPSGESTTHMSAQFGILILGSARPSLAFQDE